MKNILWGLKVEIENQYGKRCKEHNPFCATCIMWGAFDTLKEGFESTNIIPKKTKIGKLR